MCKVEGVQLDKVTSAEDLENDMEDEIKNKENEAAKGTGEGALADKSLMV